MKLKQGKALRDQAKGLGISLQALPGDDEKVFLPKDWAEAGITRDPKPDLRNDPEIQRRVMEALRHRRDARLWLVALASAIASALSAAASWYAAFHK